MNLSPPTARYLQAFAEAERAASPVSASELARKLGVTPSAILLARERLNRNGLISQSKGARVELTEPGRQIVSRLRERHDLLVRMLTQIFGMSPELAEQQASVMQYLLSEEFERKIREKLGEPVARSARALASR